ncbi:MAG: glycosyltransferase family 39 protein [Candidatus Omnitrophica bacterium]|nr:glycosyltransferase family 39 protein [Candidatus Omnitrophota bacterium]
MHKQYLFVFVLLLVFGIMGISSMLQLSGTCDEIGHHIPVAYILLSKGDLKMDTSQPPLARYLMGLPLRLLLRLNVPDDKSLWRVEDRAAYGKDFFYKYNSQPKRMLLLSRLAIFVVGIVCGLVLFLWIKKRYGWTQALLGLSLFVFSPNILAHAGLATTDMVATCTMLLAIISFSALLENPSRKTILIAGLFLGLAQLAKYTSLLLYPLFILLSFIELIYFDKKRSREVVNMLGGMFLISFVVLWAGYGFEFRPILEDAMRSQEKVAWLKQAADKLPQGIGFFFEKTMHTVLFRVPIPLGSHLLGILGVWKHGQEGHGTFFMGRWSAHGNPFYFLLAMFIKTPVPTLILLVMGTWAAFRQGLKRFDRIVFISIVFLFIAASSSKLQLGLRYILPLYPLFFIVASRSAELMKNRAIQIFICALVVWLAISSARIWPNYLSYFNESIGGPKNGHLYLRDSNIDWGQDLPLLAAYLKRNHIEEVKMYYFGTADPAQYGIRYTKCTREEFDFPNPVFENKVYVISTHWYGKVPWTTLFNYKDRVGYTFFVYDFRQAPQTR